MGPIVGMYAGSKKKQLRQMEVSAERGIQGLLVQETLMPVTGMADRAIPLRQ